MRLIHADQCSTVGDVIPDTNGKGNMHGGGGHHRHDDDGGDGGSGSSGVKKFFMFVLVTGERLILAGLARPGALSSLLLLLLLHAWGLQVAGAACVVSRCTARLPAVCLLACFNTPPCIAPPAGILATVAGVVWVHCLPEGLREQLAERLAPLLGILAGLFELVLDYIIAAWDWARSKFSGVWGGRSTGRGAG